MEGYLPSRGASYCRLAAGIAGEAEQRLRCSGAGAGADVVAGQAGQLLGSLGAGAGLGDPGACGLFVLWRVLCCYLWKRHVLSFVFAGNRRGREQ